MSGAEILGLAMLASAIAWLLMACAYAWGQYSALVELDETFEIAKSLGAYGQLLRMEASALGVTVEELAERDARLARGENP